MSHPLDADEFVLDAIVEVPRHSRNKYEIDHVTGRLRLDRTLFTSSRYPADYGFFPGTLAGDGDPLDVMVLLDEPTFPGCLIRVRPVGVLLMTDEHGEDAKILGVTAADPRFSAISDVNDVAPHLLREIAHFFAVYKEIEPGKHSEVEGWADLAHALDYVARARSAFLDGIVH